VTISASLAGTTLNSVLTIVPPTSSSSNIAGAAAVTVSSQNASTGQLGIKAVDGIVDGYPHDPSKEWVTLGQLSGAWIQLNWSVPVTVSRVVLHDRINLTENILSGTLLFSDGTSVPVGALPNDGTGLVVTFSPRTAQWIRFRVDSALGANVGLAEIENNNASNIAGLATVTVSSESASTGQLGIKAVDGVIDGYPGDYTKEWATVNQMAGAWIQLNWSVPVTVSRVVLHDRINLMENVRSGTLLFSDGSSIPVGTLPNDGTGLAVTFAAKSVQWIRFRVDTAAGLSIGLAEIEVWGF
jgi:hypothetical protein